ncbi:hypothetical protein DMENIID0001_063580 [Sergentomyia squamirostris]
MDLDNISDDMGNQNEEFTQQNQLDEPKDDCQGGIPKNMEACPTTIFTKKLIDAVRPHPCLYDVSDVSYTDKDHKLKIWEQIGRKMNKKPKECIRKFDYLKRRYALQSAYETSDKGYKEKGLEKPLCPGYSSLSFLQNKFSLNPGRKELANLYRSKLKREGKLPPKTDKKPENENPSNEKMEKNKQQSNPVSQKDTEEKRTFKDFKELCEYLDEKDRNSCRRSNVNKYVQETVPNSYQQGPERPEQQNYSNSFQTNNDDQQYMRDMPRSDYYGQQSEPQYPSNMMNYGGNSQYSSYQQSGSSFARQWYGQNSSNQSSAMNTCNQYNPLQQNFCREGSNQFSSPSTMNCQNDQMQRNTSPDSQIPDPDHIDFFFKSVANQVTNANLNSIELLGLQQEIIKALAKFCKEKFTSLKHKFIAYYAYEQTPRFREQGLELKGFRFYEFLTFLKPKVKLDGGRKVLKQKLAAKKKKDAQIKNDSGGIMSRKEKRRLREKEDPLILNRNRNEQISNYNMPGPLNTPYMQNMSPYGNFIGPSGQHHPSDPSDYRDDYGSSSNMYNRPNLMDIPLNRPLNMTDSRGPNFGARNDKIFDDRPDSAHIDFFFKSVSQQIKKANMGSLDFLRLQYTIVEALRYKMESFRNSD